ncbi:pimeloyl-CoA dehydrogenase small subunit [Sulfitobacter sp. KE34]|uniref:acyl-CoA dehydrogenase family protein n=1 Tax=unclassified Sulfitobacter TaxID=196795 RepID=UPI0023E25809|nr:MULTISPECIES: acyl-CoA dehydrogenase [unclassified Sulfitobacter]MDF3351972.1 pimeloyl-CoA dehydrogenase small subunit [Sulfitobacter sp. KE12]MDF3355643.1 pimeloyl-CoA dehydrogenase small subunit [Sulfitobacter sp. KE27]MDF3359334.1 pimeloyl-CoA dehydrogenase small subunit [Sulfitobacter sp. KE33]MDF3366758.1 pimeloyl-CoA dehydrogenase small subunit [Sulfitobacter sp. Ks34]MDF3370324.1 pimeloyl-CoA dehydrogenase small subunit [Sulfitobacter sp. Ks43]
MNFDLTEERQMLQDSLRRFLRDKYDTETRNRILESETGYSTEIWEGLAELGVIGALFTEEQGGFGGAGFDLAVVFEELGRAGVVEPLLDSAVLAGGLIADLGTEEQQEHIEQLIGGALQLAFAHGEPGSRYDLERVTTSATQNGDQIVLSGRKAVVANAEAADMLVVSARESGEAGDRDGISLFLVPADAKGLTVTGYALLAGGRAAEVTLDDVTLPESARLGAAGKAFEAIETRTAKATVALCAETLGAMETACTLTREYLGTRKQFGRPIGSFQALAHRMADLLIDLEQARSAVINAAGHLEDDRASRERHVSAAKNLMGRVGRLVSEDTIQMHGGIAMTQEYELAHIAKRITMADHRFGDVDHHLERFIALSAA